MSETSRTIGDLRLLIGGALVPGAEFVEIHNPATGLILCKAPVGSIAQLEEAIERAGEAVQGLKSSAARKHALAKASEVVKANTQLLATTLSLEIGLPYKLAEMEVAAAAAFFSHRAREAERVDAIAEDDKQRIYVRRISIGVTGAILPWNAPLLTGAEKLATAIAAGNAVVMKPSPLAPVTLLKLGALLADVFPAGALSILPGSDELGKALVADPKVGMISFTGSISAGQSIMAAAASCLKRLSLELGGNDAAIVLPDVDVPRVARRLFTAAFFRSGQICVAAKRLYVHEKVFDELVGALKAVAESNVLGDPFDAAVTMGPVSNRQQLDRVAALVADSLRSGATAVTGGAALERPGNFYPPTLVTGVAVDAPLVAQEQFGPALPILPFREVEEAIEAANGTEYGLGGSVWTSNTEAGIEIASQLECGTAWVNQHGIVLPHVPFGGVKLSGVGRANGTVGFDNYSELQTISVSLPPAKPGKA